MEISQNLRNEINKFSDIVIEKDISEDDNESSNKENESIKESLKDVNNHVNLTQINGNEPERDTVEDNSNYYTYQITDTRIDRRKVKRENSKEKINTIPLPPEKKEEDPFITEYDELMAGLTLLETKVIEDCDEIQNLIKRALENAKES